MINTLSWLFAGPLTENVKRYAAFVLVLLAAVIIIPSPKNYYTWKQYGWLFCLCVLVALWLFWDCISGRARMWMKSMVGIIHRIIYRAPRDWEDDFHQYGI